MLQVNFTGTVQSSAEIYSTGDGRQLHRFDALVSSDFISHGDLLQQTVAIRVVLTERLPYFAEHVTRGRRIFIQGNLATFRHTDAEGVDRENILVMAHFIELLDRPLTKKMAEEAVEQTAVLHVLPGPEEDLAF
jgi:uncharacterized membrane protein